MKITFSFVVEWLSLFDVDKKEVNLVQLSFYSDNLMYQRVFGINVKFFGFGLEIEFQQR